MKLTDAQFVALSTLAQFGPKELVEVHAPGPFQRMRGQLVSVSTE